MRFDVIIIGAGESGLAKGELLLKEGRRVAIVSAGRSTIPVRFAAEDIMNYDSRMREGSKMEAERRNAFRRNGGILLEGDEAIEGLLAGNMIAGVKTRKLLDDVLVADEYYLATGKFFSRGLVSNYLGIVEPVFGLDVVCPQTPAEWIDADFMAEQPFLKAHVATSSEGCGIKNGSPILNLKCIGSIAGNGIIE